MVLEIFGGPAAAPAERSRGRGGCRHTSTMTTVTLKVTHRLPPFFHPLYPSSSNCLNCCTEYPRVVFPSPATRYTRTCTCTHTHVLTSRARARANETELCVCVLVGIVHVAVGYINLLLSFFPVGRDSPCATMIGRLAERSALIAHRPSPLRSLFRSFVRSFVCTLGRWR